MKKLIVFISLFIAHPCFANLSSPPIFHGVQMFEIERHLFVDPSFTQQERQDLRQMYARATQRIKAFYGEQRAQRTDVIFCKSDNCKTYFSGHDKRPRAFPKGGQAPGGTFRASAPTIVATAAGADIEKDIAHELSHIELDIRIGKNGVPSWFEEGVASVIENDPECSRVRAQGIGDITRLKDVRTWTNYTNTYDKALLTYCQAASEIKRWMLINGKQALLNLLDEVKAGKDFDKLYFKR